MDIEVLLKFAVWAFLLALSPGPDIVFVLSESLRKGAFAGLSVSAGLVSGVVVHTLLCATGITIILASFPAAFFAIKFFGVGYMLYLAYITFMSKSEGLEISKNLDKSKRRKEFFKYYVRGFVMNVSNPKVFLFFLAILPMQISQEAAFAPSLQIMILGAIFMLMAYIVFMAVSLACGFFSALFASEKFWKVMKYVSIFVYLGLAFIFFITDVQVAS